MGRDPDSNDGACRQDDARGAGPDQRAGYAGGGVLTWLLGHLGGAPEALEGIGIIAIAAAAGASLGVVRWWMSLRRVVDPLVWIAVEATVVALVPVAVGVSRRVGATGSPAGLLVIPLPIALEGLFLQWAVLVRDAYRPLEPEEEADDADDAEDDEAGVEG